MNTGDLTIEFHLTSEQRERIQAFLFDSAELRKKIESAKSFCPISVYEVTGECMGMSAPAQIYDADTRTNGYDLGDLMAEIDEAMGQAIERTAHRYLPKPIAQDLRRRFARQLADAVILDGQQLET